MHPIGKRTLRGFAVTLALSVAPVAALAQTPDPAAVLDNYADLAFAGYQDALITAKALDVAIDALIADPSEARPGRRRACRISRRKPFASATRLSTSGKGG